MRKNFFCVLAAVCVLLTLPGCSFIDLDVESQMRPPVGAGEQSAVQQALKEYIASLRETPEGEEPLDSGGIILKYPGTGEYRSAFVFRDVDRDGVQEALAFYALSESANVHMALFSKASGVWLCSDDIEGLASEIESVTFGDLDGDRAPELLTGFGMYNTGDRLLMVYRMRDLHFAECYTDTYTHFAVAGITSDRHEDLLLYRVNAAERRTTARLLTFEGNAVVEKGQCYLDGQISSFGNYSVAQINPSLRGVYQDCGKAAQTTVTELILWDGKQLLAPLYNPAENLNSITARESGLPSMDINYDGQIEWPQSVRFPGYAATPTPEVPLWLTAWYQWDPDMLRARKMITVTMVPADGYFLQIPNSWTDKVTADYDRVSRRLIMKYVDNGVTGDEFLKIRATPVGSDPIQDGDEYVFLALGDEVQYDIWYDKECPLQPTMEQLQKLFAMRKIVM